MMTKSTGARARQYRLENLLWADVMLRRVAMHMRESAAWARRGKCDLELESLGAAYNRVHAAYLEVLAEQRALKESGAAIRRLHVAYSQEDYKGAECYPERREGAGCEKDGV